MKKLLLIISIAVSISASAQDDKTVTLVVSGQGKTQDEAKQNALRSAIEQAFGTFISSKTEILNDKLVKDEIVSVSNGNIQKFDVLSEVQIPDGNYATTLKAVVSVTKLTSFCESRGVEVEFNGSLFAHNVKQKNFNEQSEIKAIDNFITVVNEYIPYCFDYKIQNSKPTALDLDNKNWGINIKVVATCNSNMAIVRKMILDNFRGIALSNDERSDYYNLNKPAYKFEVDSFNFYFRKEETIINLAKLFTKFDIAASSFKVTDGNQINFANCLISSESNSFRCTGWSFYESYLYGEMDHFYFVDSLTFEFTLIRTLDNISKINSFKVLSAQPSEKTADCPGLTRLIINNPNEERPYHYSVAVYNCGNWEDYFKKRFHIPNVASQKGISGIQIFAYDIDEKGEIENIRTIGGFEDYPDIQKANLDACRGIIANTKKCWKPARCNGFPTKSTLTFRFGYSFR